jgi:hypothetical protein
VDRRARRERVVEYERQIENLEASQSFILEKLAEAQYVVVFLQCLDDTYARDIADLKIQCESVKAVDGRLPGLGGRQMNGKRVNKPRKRQPTTRRQKGALVSRKEGGPKPNGKPRRALKP